MTPTTLLGGILTGLVDGAIIAVLVTSVIYLLNRRHKPAEARHPVGGDVRPPSRRHTPDDDYESRRRDDQRRGYLREVA